MPVTFLSNASVLVAENSGGAVRNIQAALNGGPADAGLTYSITGGPDAALFAVDSASGLLSFISAPDFETPGDVGSDNIYNVEVTASDAGSQSAIQVLTVTVTNDVVEQAVTGVNPSFELSGLDGSNGFIINGVDAGDLIGNSVSSAGDINGDGFDDLIIGTAHANSVAGASYVVYGSSSGFTAPLDLSNLDGSNGFVINGVAPGDVSGNSVSNAGDVNGDGFDDLIIGGYGAGPNGAGASYVVFGSSSGFAASFELSSLDGSNGFVTNGIDPGDRSGISVSNAGDVNGDGFDDLIIGASGAGPNGIDDAGESYVVFGSASLGFTGSFDLSSLDGSNGFIINGINTNDGNIVSGAGDINGDGFDDLIIGADAADPNDNFSAGESYVVFGSASGFAASLDLSSLDGSNGFVINGIAAQDRSGISVSNAGDVNGDGIDDLIIGARGVQGGGASYVVFGSSSGFPATLELSNLDGRDGFALGGISGGDRTGISVSSAGDVNGDGFDDLIIGATLADPDGNRNAGQSYVVYGGVRLGLDKIGGDNDDTLTGNDANNRLIGNDGDDYLEGKGGNDFLNGGAGNDTIDGGDGDDQIFAGPGDDGDDSFAGGSGDDIVGGGAGNDFLVGDNFINDGVGDRGSDTLFGGTGNDVIIVGSWNDLNGDGIYDEGEANTTGASSNVAYAGTGDDSLYGANGDDILGGGDGDDHVVAGGGDDVVYAGRDDGADDIQGGDGNDLIFASRGNDDVSGDDGNDTLFGGGGDDTIAGGDGNDQIYGGAGNDLLRGDDGADTFYFAGNHGNDIIEDFDVTLDSLFLVNATTDFTSLDDVLAASQVATVGGQLGILIDTGGGSSVFLTGLDLNDIQSVELVL